MDAFEQAFHQETEADRVRRAQRRRAAVVRAQQRRRQQAHKRSTLRFAMLVLTLLGTAVVVALAMFETLYIVMG